MTAPHIINPAGLLDQALGDASPDLMRKERCRLVVEDSLTIGRLEREQAPAAEQTAVVDRALAKLAEPI